MQFWPLYEIAYFWSYFLSTSTDTQASQWLICIAALFA